jgi:hypothetical protein
LGSVSADFVIALIDRTRLTVMVPEVTDIDAHPHLASIKVTMCPAPEQYQALLAGGISCDDDRITQ